jgi:hypothetical protein
MMSRSGHPVLLTLICACLLFPRAVVSADEPDVQTKMKRAFEQLADSDADVRDAARAELMGMERRYLPDLRKLVEQNRPLLPSQAAVLRQLVTQIYLAGEPYPDVPTKGFLGVHMQPTTVHLPVAAADDPPANELPSLPQTGVVIVERLPGFAGARSLLDGDVILAIAEQPQVQFAKGEAFIQAIADTAPGETIHFHVLRRGRVVKVRVVLDARPSAADDRASVRALDEQRREKADAYWQESFAPLVNEHVG